ncbi:MAG: hypothetical protein IKL14_03270 [Alphaproteobacteria bacterium]|nr:hypothetical protein [Alphaproteobacteria bacterium]
MKKIPYYHGSATAITDDYLQAPQQQTKYVNGQFVTTDLEYAKIRAIIQCIRGGQAKISDNKIYLERLQDNIIPSFYIYTVYEPTDKPFIQDDEDEYHSTEPIRIAERTKYNTAKEISTLGFDVFVLDEPINEVGVKKAEIMNEAIQNGKIHRIDIEDIMRVPEKLYHGSMKEKKEGVIQPFPGNIKGAIPRKREDIVAVFATTKSKATVYGARHLIMGEYGNCSLHDTKDTLFTTTVNPNISGKIYLYELDSEGFILDQDEEYYCLTEKKILRTITLDVREEIRKGNIKIYVPKANIDFSKLSEQERDELFDKLIQDINNWRQYNPSDIDMTTTLANQGPDR